MTIEILILFIIVGVAVIIFALELLPVDQTAFGLMVLLTLFGLISPEEAISGFANPAVITILNLMIIAWALERNGVIRLLSDLLSPVVKWPFFIAIPILMLTVASISAFISTTAVVIVFIKMISQFHAQGKIKNTLYLLPISFAGIIGGSATLMGTSTNLIVREISERRGVDTLTFFEFSHLGLIFLGITILVVTLLVPLVIKERDEEDLEASYDVDNYLTNIELTAESKYANKTIREIPLFSSEDAEVLSIERRNAGIFAPSDYYKVDHYDKIFIRSSIEKLAEIKESKDFNILGVSEQNEGNEKIKSEQELGEVIVMPSSNVIGASLKGLTQILGQDAIPLAIKKHKTFINQKYRLVKDINNRTKIEVGDRILLSAEKGSLNKLAQNRKLLLYQEYKDVNVSTKKNRILSIAVLALTIALAASGLTSILLATLIGTFSMIFLGLTSLSSAYKSINWSVIFLLAGMIPIGLAMKNTGADDYIIEGLQVLFAGQTSIFVLGAIFLFTMIMSGIVSNNATAIIMTPIAIALALGLQINPKAFILAVMFGANFSFFTPIGYQTNTIIYAMGIYKFRDFLIIGGLLSLLLWIASILLINHYYLS